MTEQIIYNAYRRNSGRKCDCMKKLMAFVLTLICVFGLVGCSVSNTNNSKPQTEANNTTTSENGTTTNPSETNPPVDNDAAFKAELIAKYGLPFRLWRTEGMALWEFTIGENTAKREYHHSMEGSFSQESLSWEIVDGELVITGDWSETFTLDMEDGQAISKTDGAVYRIVEEQE